MSKRTFKNTYIVLFGAFDSDKFVKFSKFKTVEDFKKHLNKKHLSYDAGEGIFIHEDDEDRDSCFYICEKKYYEDTGCIADWDHVILQDYLNARQCDIAWAEDCESTWFACGRYDLTAYENLEAIFNDLKSIDGIEIELELPEHWNMSEILADRCGEYMFGDAFNDCAKEINTNDLKSKQYETGYLQDASNDSSSNVTFVDWDAVDKMLREQNNKWPVTF